MATKAYQRWLKGQRGQKQPARPAVLLEADGTFEIGDYERLLFRRDNRPVYIIE